MEALFPIMPAIATTAARLANGLGNVEVSQARTLVNISRMTIISGQEANLLIMKLG